MDSSDIDLDLILARLSSGDKVAFDWLYNRYSGKIYNFILALSGNSLLAQDITQEVFIKVWRKRQEIDPAQNFEAWLFVCSKNMYLNEVRLMGSKSKYTKDIFVLKTEEDNGTTDAIDYHFTKQDMERTISKMPAQRRKIFLLSKVYGLSIAEIAQRMNISERTVESQLYKAKKFVTSKINHKS